MMMLTACASPGRVQLEENYPPIPAEPAISWHAYQAQNRPQAPNTSSFPTEDAGIDTQQTYDLSALVDLALHTHPETRMSWEEAKAAAARLERNRSSWYPTLTAMAFGQHFTSSFPIPGSALVSNGCAAFASLDLAWTLFDFGRREALVNAGAERLSAANFAFDRKHQEIAYRVASSFLCIRPPWPR